MRMTMRNSAAIAALCLLVNVSLANAEEPLPPMQVAGKDVMLELPEKTCAYNKKEKADAKILEAMENADPRSKLLLAFIDCDNLNAVRGIKGATYQPAYYGQILSHISGQASADNYTREAYVKAIDAQYGKEAPEKVMERGEASLKVLVSSHSNDGQAQVIGRIKQDKDFIQVAMIGSQQTPAGSVQMIINVITFTKLGVPVAIYLAHPATSDMTLHALSDHSEQYVRQLITLNPDGNFFLGMKLDTWSVIVGAVGGILFSVFIGFVGLLVRKH